MNNTPPAQEENNVDDAAAEYIQQGWYLVPLAAGDKRPTEENWSRLENCLSENNPPTGTEQGIGLAHRYSRTCTIDLDDLAKAEAAFKEAGIDIDQYLNAPDAVKIISGRENRSKLLYRLPTGVDELPSVKRDSEGFELRCATKNGTTLQDVLPPSIHPATGKAYTFVGDWRELPELPEPLLQFWTDILDARDERTWEPGKHPDLMEPLVDSALAAIDPDMEYNDWLSIGMGLDTYGWGDKWDEWSSEGSKYKPGDCEARLYGFDPNGGITLATLWHHAKEAGWERREQFGDLFELIKDSSDDYDTDLDRLAYLLRACGPSSGAREKAEKAIAKKHGVRLSTLQGDLKSAGGLPASDQEFVADLRLRYPELLFDGVDVYIYEQRESLWVPRPADAWEGEILTTHDGNPRMRTHASARSVFRSLCAMNFQSDVWSNAPVGLATADGFWRIVDGGIQQEPNAPDHYQRTALPFKPDLENDPELFLAAMKRSMGFEPEQITLLEEMIGAVLLSLCTRNQQAFLLYGESGTGKSVLMEVIEAMFHSNAVTSIPPQSMDEPYQMATLAGAALNRVSELPRTQDIGSNAFKAAVCGELVNARHPGFKVTPVHPTAGHVFSSNYIPTVSFSDASWYRRFRVLEFRNPVPEAERDPTLADRIIEAELPQIAGMALRGAERLLATGQYTSTLAHRRFLEAWRSQNNVSLQFLHDEAWIDLTDENAKTNRSHLYRAFLDWCDEQRVKPNERPLKSEFNEAVGSVRPCSKDGDGAYVYRKVRLKVDRPGLSPSDDIPAGLYR